MYKRQVIGSINGLLITKGGMPAMVATMAMMGACRSIINHFGSGGPFTVESKLFASFRPVSYTHLDVYKRQTYECSY